MRTLVIIVTLLVLVLLYLSYSSMQEHQANMAHCISIGGQYVIDHYKDYFTTAGIKKMAVYACHMP